MAQATRVFIGGNDANLYRIGRVGFDTGAEDSDSGTTLQATIKTNVHHPAGKDSLFHFRRVAFRFLRISPEVNLTCTVYIDNAQTQLYSSGTLVDQDFSKTTTGGGIREEVIEFDLNAVGTSVQVEATFDAGDTDPTGAVMLETIEVHGRPVREAKSRSADVGS